MGRNPCCVKEGLNKGAWTKMEDRTLTEYIAIHGEGKWRNLPKRAGLKRCGKSCRLRWLNYLRPDIKRGNITRDEEDLIIRLHKLLGNRWSLIAGRLPGRTDNEIKNFWNTNFGNKKAHDHSSTNSETTNVTTTPRKSPKNQTPPKNTYVVRTKASRCTKVFLPHKSQSDNYATSDDNNSNPTTNQLGATPLDYYDPTINDHRRLLPVDGLFSPFLNMENNDDDVNGNSCGFIGDFRLDEGFLSEFLNVDFSELYGGEGGKANITSCVENDHHELHGVASRSSMAPIIDSEVDCWLS